MLIGIHIPLSQCASLLHERYTGVLSTDRPVVRPPCTPEEQGAHQASSFCPAGGDVFRRRGTSLVSMWVLSSWYKALLTALCWVHDSKLLATKLALHMSYLLNSWYKALLTALCWVHDSKLLATKLALHVSYLMSSWYKALLTALCWLHDSKLCWLQCDAATAWCLREDDAIDAMRWCSQP